MSGSLLPPLAWLIGVPILVMLIAGVLVWRPWVKRHGGHGLSPDPAKDLSPADNAALGFLCLARYSNSVPLPGEDLYPVHSILHFRRLPREFLPGNQFRTSSDEVLEAVSWIRCVRSAELQRVAMRLLFDQHVAGTLFQVTEEEFRTALRLAVTMVPGARILDRSATPASPANLDRPAQA